MAASNLKEDNTPMTENIVKINGFYNKMMSKKSTYIIAYSVFFIFLAIGVFSYTETYIWNVDGWEQHFKAYVYNGQYFRELIKNIFVNHSFVIPQWDFSIGEGADVLGTFNYYSMGDPFAFFAFLSPTKYMHIYYGAMVLLRLYLAGLSFSLYCSYMGKKGKYIFPGALCYVFCYWGIYNAVRHPFFLNPLIYYPLILLGIEKIIKKEKPYVFILTVTVSALSNFYFFYMIVLLTILYVVVRAVFLYGKDVKRWGKLILTLLGYSILGLLMSFITFLPVLNFFISDSRFESGNVYRLIYPFSYYSKLPGLFTIEGDKFWTCLGFAVPVLFAIILLFKQKKQNRELKAYFVIGLIMMIVPFFGQFLNGMSYMCNRWIFAFALLCCYIFVHMLPELISLKNEETKSLSKWFALYLIVSIVGVLPKVGKIITVALLGGAVLLALSLKKCSKAHKEMTILAVVLLAILGNAFWKYSTFGDKYAKESVSRYTAENDLFSDETTVIKEIGENDGFLRYCGEGLEYNANTLEGISFTGLYWTLTNDYASKFRADLGLPITSILPHKFQGYDGKSNLVHLSSADFYVLPVSMELQSNIVPEGFSLAGKTDEYLTYINSNPLPLGYTYDKSVNYKDWLKLDLNQRQEILSKAVILDKTIDNQVSTDLIKLNSKKIDYTIDCKQDEVNVYKDKFVVMKPGASITLKFNTINAAEAYINIKGLEYSGASEFQLYYGDEKYDPEDIYSKEKWDSLATKDRFRIIRNFVFWTKSTSKVWLDFRSNEGVHKQINYFTPDYSYYSGQKDFSINLGVADNGTDSIDITFENIGVYSFDSVDVVSMPVDGLSRDIEELKKDSLFDVELSTNKVVGNINCNKDEVLLLTIPYSKGWIAYVDGEESPILNANGQYMGIELSKGEHNIKLVYRTPLLKEGAIICIIAWIAFALLIIINILNKNKEKKNV